MCRKEEDKMLHGRMNFGILLLLIWQQKTCYSDIFAHGFGLISSRQNLPSFGIITKAVNVRSNVWSIRSSHGSEDETVKNDTKAPKKKAVKYQLTSVDKELHDMNVGDHSSHGINHDDEIDDKSQYWNIPQTIEKKQPQKSSTTVPPIEETEDNGSTQKSKTVTYSLGVGKNDAIPNVKEERRKVVTKDDESRFLTRALWMYSNDRDPRSNPKEDIAPNKDDQENSSKKNILDIHNNDPDSKVNEREEDEIPPIQYQDIDLSISDAAYCKEKNIDLVWDLLKWEAQREAVREPLLISFLYANILNHDTLESALAFHLANRLSSPAMISTQIMSLIQEALANDVDFSRAVRADLMAVRDRDPACSSLPSVFLYFKGFHALTIHRVAHYLWQQQRHVLAHFLQSRISTEFQIDIHPNATMGSGLMLDHGTGIVIGETAIVGHNCSILHHVTLGGSGKKGVDRHPKVGNGVLLGAGCSVLGNIRVGNGCQVGAGTLVISDLPDHSVAVGVPARIIGAFLDSQAQPSTTMNQLGTKESDEAMVFTYETDGI